MTFASIEDQKKAQKSLENSIKVIEDAQLLVRALFDMNEDPMAVLDESGKIVIANTSYAEFMNINQNKLVGFDFIDMQAEVAKIVDLKTKLSAALKQGEDFETKGFEKETSKGKQGFKISGHIIKKDKDFPYRILLRIFREQ